MEERLIKLEVLYANQSRMVEDLSSEMYLQQQDIVRLTRRIEMLEAKLAALAEPGEIGGHERPPHY